MGTNYAGYHVIRSDQIRALTDQEESNLMERLSEQYRREAEHRVMRYKFVLSAHLNWQRNHEPIQKHLLQLKKPILPERWGGYRSGWNLTPKFKWPEWMENLRAHGMDLEKLKDELLRYRPTPISELYFDRDRMVVGWRVPPEVEE